MASRELAEDIVREDEGEMGWVLSNEDMMVGSNITIDMGSIFKQMFGSDVNHMIFTFTESNVGKHTMNLIKFAYILACKFVTVDERQVRDQLLDLIVSNTPTQPPIPVGLDRRARGEEGHVVSERVILKSIPFATQSRLSLIFIWLCIMNNIIDLVAKIPGYNHILEQLNTSTIVPTDMLADMVEGRRLEVRRGRIIFISVKEAEDSLKVAIQEANLQPYEMIVLQPGFDRRPNVRINLGNPTF